MGLVTPPPLRPTARSSSNLSVFTTVGSSSTNWPFWFAVRRFLTAPIPSASASAVCKCSTSRRRRSIIVMMLPTTRIPLHALVHEAGSSFETFDGDLHFRGAFNMRNPARSSPTGHSHVRVTFAFVLFASPTVARHTPRSARSRGVFSRHFAFCFVIHNFVVYNCSRIALFRPVRHSQFGSR